MAVRWNYLSVLILSIVISGCLGRHSDDDHHDDYQEDVTYSVKWNWNNTKGIGVTIAIVAAICGFLSLASWIVCHFYNKLRKDRVDVIKVGGRGAAPPAWSASLIFKSELAAGFTTVSDGFLRIGPTQLVRNRGGTSNTDGAKWDVGMTKGKHVFEIICPWGQRGNYATVGVGLESAPITAKGIVPLVGADPTTWGFDIVKRRVLHNNKTVGACPTDGSYVPDRFLMYVNMDEGTLGYGNGVTYWGEVITDLPRHGTQALYVMVGVTQYQSEICVNYKGSAPDGTADDKAGGGQSQYLPPMNPTTSQVDPPTYTEFVKNKLPVMDRPPGPSNEVMYEDPPPYPQPPTTFEPEQA